MKIALSESRSYEILAYLISSEMREKHVSLKAPTTNICF